MNIGLTGVSATSTVGGIILDALTEQPTGQQATITVGDLTIGIGIPLTGVVATSSVASSILLRSSLSKPTCSAIVPT